MTQVTLYHSTRCPYSRRVRFVLEELGVAYDEVEVSLDDPPQWFEEIAMGGQVPCLVHGDVNLVESATIMQYLDEVFGGGLMPGDAADRAYARNVIQWVDEEWMPRFHAFEEDPQDEAATAGLRAALDGLEDRFIGRGPYVVGRRIGLADIAVATTLTELPRHRVDLRRHPKTAALLQALLEHPACQRVPTRPLGEVHTRSR